MMTLYGAKGSGSAAIEAALVLVDQPYRLVEGATWEPGPGYDELLRVNPLGQVPTLVLDEGTVMSESAAILMALADRFPESGLLPADPAARARAYRALVFIAANCYAAIGVFDYPERWCADCDDATRERIRNGSRARLHQLWELFADLAVPAPWLTGEQFGAVDILAGVVSRWSGARQHLNIARPAFAELLVRIDAEPRVAEVFARHWPPQ